MNILVAGANGQIGGHLVNQIEKESPHSAQAMVRKKEQQQTFEEQGVGSVLVDLEDSVETIAGAAKGCDAIVFTAGSGAHTGADKTMMIDLDAAVKTMEAAKKAGISRFIMVSAIGVHRRENWQGVPYYFAAKYYADEWLKQSELDYTIIRPGGLTDEAGTGHVRIASDLEFGWIPREDVAGLILAALDENRTIGKSFDAVSGETPIGKAVLSI